MVVTVISRWARDVAKAEAEKRRKYATYLAQCLELGFCPFALDLHGGIGTAAWKEIVTWAQCVARQPSQQTDYTTALNEIVADIAWTFVDEVTRQIRSAADPRFARSYC